MNNKVLFRICLGISIISILITIPVIIIRIEKEREYKEFEEYINCPNDHYGPPTIPNLEGLNIDELPTKPHTSVFEIICGTSSILGLFFTIFFRYKDKKEKRKKKKQSVPDTPPVPLKPPQTIITNFEKYNNDYSLCVEGNIHDNRYVNFTIYNKSSTKMHNFEVKVLQNDDNDNLTGYLPFVVKKKKITKDIEPGLSVLAEIDWNYYKKEFTVEFEWKTLDMDSNSMKEHRFPISFKVVSNQLSV